MTVMNDAIEFIPPHDKETEQAVLACMMLDRGALATAAELLDPTSFYLHSHALLFAQAVELFGRNEPVDAITLRDALAAKGRLEAIGGLGYLVDLASSRPTTVYIEHYAQIVAEKAIRRALLHAATEAMRLARDESIEAPAAQAQKLFLDIDTGRANRAEWVRYGDALAESLKRTEQAEADGGSVSGAVETGFYDLDQMATIAGGDVVVIAARTGYGKTALAWDMARNIAGKRGMVAVFSLEMSRAAIARRALAAATGVSVHRQVKGVIGDAEWGPFLKAIDVAHSLDIYIHDESNITVPGMQSALRRLESTTGRKVDVAIIDYLQLVEGEGKGGDNETARVAKASRGIKTRIAGDFDCVAIALAQLNRGVDGRETKRPELRDIKQSGSVEQDASLILLVHREGHVDGKPLASGPVEVIVAKNRNGAQGSVTLDWRAERASFTDYGGQWG
jgi:replicative DNA helicase